MSDYQPLNENQYQQIANIKVNSNSTSLIEKAKNYDNDVSTLLNLIQELNTKCIHLNAENAEYKFGLTTDLVQLKKDIKMYFSGLEGVLVKHDILEAGRNNPKG